MKSIFVTYEQRSRFENRSSIRNKEIDYSTTISSMEDVETIEKYISDLTGGDYITIINWKRFE